jgi:hypothetical protein
MSLPELGIGFTSFFQRMEWGGTIFLPFKGKISLPWFVSNSLFINKFKSSLNG